MAQPDGEYIMILRNPYDDITAKAVVLYRRVGLWQTKSQCSNCFIIKGYVGSRVLIYLHRLSGLRNFQLHQRASRLLWSTRVTILLRMWQGLHHQPSVCVSIWWQDRFFGSLSNTCTKAIYRYTIDPWLFGYHRKLQSLCYSNGELRIQRHSQIRSGLE